MSAPPAPGIVATLRDAFRTPAGVAGGAMLLVLISMLVIVPIYAPFDVVQSWTNFDRWEDNPSAAAPEWVDVFTSGTLPRTAILDQDDFRKIRYISEDFNARSVVLRTTFDFNYDDFPSELVLWTWTQFAAQSPIVNITFERPDGEKVYLLQMIPTTRAPGRDYYPLSNPTLDPRIEPVLTNFRSWAITRFNATDVAHPRTEVTLFARGGEEMLDPKRAQVLQGRYTIQIAADTFVNEDDIDAKFIVYGKVFGLAGTDKLRRDLLLGIMWGAPVALAFGFIAAVVIVLVQAFLGVLSAWYGGRIDGFIQRAADFFLIIPILPILILIGYIWRPTIALILLIIVGLGFVGQSTKVIRSIALQVKEEQFVESAQSYGAGRMRILLRHIFPRALPYTFALIALSVPSYIFLEASLAFLGVSDAALPTWGDLMGDAYAEQAINNGWWWWVTLPASGIIFTTVAFALLGYSFDRVLNPRLREQ